MRKACLPLVLAVACLAACAGPPSPTPTPTPTPDEWLDRAAQAVLVMKSAQFTLTREGAPVVLDQESGTTFVEAAGQYQAPDRVRATVKVILFGNTFSLQMLWLPEGNYVSNPLTGAIEQAPAGAALNGAALFGPTGISAVLRDGIQNARLVGTETLEDVETFHLAGEAGGTGLAALTAGALASGALYPVDVWMDTKTSQVVRVHISEPDGNGWLIELYDIDKPVEIKAPPVAP